MAVVAMATAAAMTLATAAAVTAATAAAETKAAVVVVKAALTAAEAAANVAAMVAEAVLWWRLQQLQLWHVGKIWAMLGHMQSQGNRMVTLEICVFDLDFPKNGFFNKNKIMTQQNWFCATWIFFF